MKLTQGVKMAYSSIRSNKMRSFLTMLGIIIGIFSVIVLITIGQGTKEQVEGQIQNLGTNLITINITGNRNRALTQEDIDTLKTKPGIKNIAPAILGGVNTKAGTKTYSTSLEATIPVYQEIRNIHAQQGRFITLFDIEARSHVAVIGVVVADELFGNRDVVGKTISLNGNDFMIVGLLEEKGSTMGGSTDDKVIIPLTTAQRLLRDMNVRTFYAEAESPDMVNTAMGYLQLFLMKKFNNDESSFRVFNQTELLSTITQTSNSLTMMLGGIAAISLLVGGIGIMNIMLVSVTERTREIGIRKAVGGKRRHILFQFLIESMFLSGIGGIIGVILGFGGARLLGSIFKIPIAISPSVILISFTFSITVGMIFGLHPAVKASKLSPIEALRYE